MDMIFFRFPEEEQGYLSNWYISYFELDGIRFSSLEQYMMYQKAKCFNDCASMEKILKTHDPHEIKQLGRQVADYEGTYWNGIRQIVVYNGLLAKFSQNEDLKEMLKATGDAILVECARKDTIWAIGLSLDDEDRFDVSKWRGQNLLGYALMMVREQL